MDFLILKPSQTKPNEDGSNSPTRSVGIAEQNRKVAEIATCQKETTNQAYQVTAKRLSLQSEAGTILICKQLLILLAVSSYDQFLIFFKIKHYPHL